MKIQALGVSSENEELDKVSVRLEEKEVERASPETQRLQGMVDTAEDERLQVETGITAEEKWMIERNLLRQENQELRKQLGETEEQAEEREQDLANAEMSLQSREEEIGRLQREVQQLRDSFDDRLASRKKMYEEAVKNVNVPSDTAEVDEYLRAVIGRLDRCRAEKKDYAAGPATLEARQELKDLTIEILEGTVRRLKLNSMSNRRRPGCEPVLNGGWC